MKNAPVTSEHTITASYLIGLIRTVRASTPDAAYEASIGGLAQAMANLEARIAHKAWDEAYAQGRHDALKDEYDADSHWTDNPYPKLGP